LGTTSAPHAKIGWDDDRRTAMSLAKVATVNAGRIDSDPDLLALMTAMGRRARAAARTLALTPTARKDEALTAMAQAVRAHPPDILAASAEDIAEAKASGATAAFIDRLRPTGETARWEKEERS